MHAVRHRNGAGAQPLHIGPGPNVDDRALGAVKQRIRSEAMSFYGLLQSMGPLIIGSDARSSSGRDQHGSTGKLPDANRG